MKREVVQEMRWRRPLLLGILALTMIALSAAAEYEISETLTTQNLVVQSTSSLAAASATSMQLTGGTAVTQTTCNSPNGVLTGAKGAVCYDASVPTIWQNTNGATAWSQVGAGSISGLTSGVIPVATSASTIGNGDILDNTTTHTVTLQGTDVLSLGGTMRIDNNASGGAQGALLLNNYSGIEINSIGTNITATGGLAWVDSIATGTFNTTGWPTTGLSYALAGDNRSQRVAGTQLLENIGVYAKAINGDINWALFVDGDTAFNTGQVIMNNKLTVHGDTVTGFGVQMANTNAGKTVAFSGVNSAVQGSTDATVSNLQNTGVYGEASATRSAGANQVTNVGLQCAAFNGQTNNCLVTTFGDNQLNVNSGTTLMYGGLLETGNVTLNNSSGTASLKGATTVSAAFSVTGTTETLGGITSTIHVTTKDTSARPTLSGCGTGPTVVGNDAGGKITIGTGGATACVLTFNTAYSANVSCLPQRRQGSITSYALTTTTLTVNGTFAASDIIDYECEDH